MRHVFPKTVGQRHKPWLCVALRAAAVAALLVAGTSARGQITLPNVLGDHAVLQREAPIHIWGWAAPHEVVTITLNTQRQKTTADDLGRWSLSLNPEHAGGPYTLTAQGQQNTVTASDVLLGDVWIASGQSNMEMPLKGFSSTVGVRNGGQEIANATLPQVRLLRLPHRSSPYPLENQPAHWTACTPATAAGFSAVAYFFGREIQEQEHVPIGLIDSSWGGTPAEAWTSMEALSSDSSLMPVFQTRAQLMQREADTPLLLAEEARQDAAAKAASQPLPKHPWRATPESAEPGGLFNGMIAPLAGLQIKGFIWYQGESNTPVGRAPTYARLFNTLISDWRAKFGQGDLPFLFVQLSSFNSSSADSWGMVRDAQRRTLNLTRTAMAVTLDVGEFNNIHPADKQSVGHRLTLAARAVAYGEALEYSGPLFRQAEPAREGKAIRMRFDHANDGFEAHGPALEGFEVAGADHLFRPATAQIDGRSIVARSSEIPAPVYVRYAWANASAANLYNKQGLPASTFTSEASPSTH